MKCINCGASVTSTDALCKYCGSEIIINDNDLANIIPKSLSKKYLYNHFTELQNKISNRDIYLYPNIPKNLEIKAIKKFGLGYDDEEQIFFLHDPSAYEFIETGLFMTDKYIYYNLGGTLRAKIALSDVKYLLFKKSFFNWEVFVNNQCICKFKNKLESLKDDFIKTFSGIFKIKLK